MASKQNIIYVYFKGKHLTISKSQYQYNHGQFLYFADLDLPQTFEVHFSNRDRGESKLQIGSDKLVEIPDEYFWSGALQIYAWIYLHSGVDDGETVYEVKIPLIKRAKPTDEEPLPQQQGVIDRAIAELNNAINITTENANKTDSDKTIVSNIKEDVITLKGEIDSTAITINQKAQETINASERAETSAQNAATSENKALNYSQQAEQSAQSALESKNIAQQKSEVATNASSEALGYRNEALEAKNQAVQAKQNIVDYRNETKEYRDETLNLKNNVQILKNQIDETAEEIEDISDSVKEDAQSASRSASSANQSSINASQSASQAKKSADDAEESANQAEQNKNQTETFKNQSEEYKTQAETFKSQAETFKNQAEEFKNQTETNVTHYPKIIGEYWYVWDATNGEYVNTNVDANGIKGDTGRGIASVALNDDYTLTITFTDDTTYTTSSIRGQQGEKGDTGKTGESGVYIGTEEPENKDIKVWIDTDDDGTSEDLVADIADLQETNKKILNTYPTKTVSGAIATFDDSVDGLPLENLNVDINPIQNLNGYDHPWVGGSGKNLLNLNRSTIVDSGSHPRLEPKEFNEDQIWVGLSFNDYFIPSRVSKYNIAEDTVSLTITSSGYGIGFPIKCEAGTSYAISQLVISDENICFGIGFYDETGTYISSQSQAVSKVFTTPSTCEWLVVVFAPKNAQVETTYTKPQLEKGSTITDYTPYENICPISGWTGCNIQRDGKNLLALPVIRFNDRTATVDNCFYLKQGTYTLSYSCADTHRFGVRMMDASGVIYTASTDVPISGFYYNSSAKCYYAGANLASGSRTFTLTVKHDCYVRIVSNLTDGGFTDVQLEIGDTATEYEPYKGRIININWEDEADTVYGGKLDVLSGKMMVDMVSTTFGQMTGWTKSVEFNYFVTTETIPDAINVSAVSADIKNVASSIYPSAIISNTNSELGISLTKGRIRVRQTDMSMATDAWLRKIKDEQFCYKLAIPIEIQLEPHEIVSLLGQNNIFANTGDSTVEYIYDPMKYIDDQINVDDVQINDVSIVQDGVAKIPFATSDTAGVVKVDPYTQTHYGGVVTVNNKLYVIGSSFNGIKYGGDYSKPIVAGNQHVATFYGLAKASGVDEKDSTLPVGQYTDEAKASIKNMIGVDVEKEDVYSVYATDTATGRISTFEDGANEIPLKSLVVDINPVQDLHGYDSPWVGGGGKNKINAPDVTISSGSYLYNGALALPAGTYTLSFTSSSGASTSASLSITDADGTAMVTGGHVIPYTFTLPNASVAVKIYVSSAGTYTNIQIEEGSTATDYAPYENICPISGWTEALTNISGINVWDGEWEIGNWGIDTGEKGTFRDRIRCKNYIPVVPSAAYYFGFPDSNKARILCYDKSKNYLGQLLNTNEKASGVYIMPDNCRFVTFNMMQGYGTTYNHDISINYPSTDHDYHPYVGQSIPISWQTEAGTVYGGKLDVLNGVMTITHEKAVVTSFSGVFGQTTNGYGVYTTVGKYTHVVPSYEYRAMKSNMFTYSRFSRGNMPLFSYGGNDGAYVTQTYILPNTITSLAEANAWLSALETPLECTFYLATPIEIQLDPHEIASLLGQNNIWADTGDTTAEYRADTKLYINKKITEAISALT